MIQSYLSHRQSTVHYGEAKSALLYLLYTADIPAVQNIHVVAFADDIAILALHDNYFSVTLKIG